VIENIARSFVHWIEGMNQTYKHAFAIIKVTENYYKQVEFLERVKVPQKGEDSYCLRVLQENGIETWSSPI